MRFIPVLTLLPALMMTSLAWAQSAASPTQAEMDAAIRDYLLRNPEVIMEALNVLEQRQVQARLDAVAEDLRNNPNDLVLGNPEGDVTIVKFSDYRCPWCQRAHPVVDQLIENDPNVKVVVKQFPVLGPDSVAAARLALAAKSQSETAYVELHHALMDMGGKMTTAQVLEVAAEVGLNTDQLQQDAQLPAVAETIQSTYQVARALDFNGTPAFVIGDTLSPGFVDLPSMTAQVAAARAAQSAN